MDVKLNDIDRRVLGVLMEKEMSQPDYYPMTLNAVVAACNQKQNRDPVMSLDEVATEAALGSLQDMGLLTAMFPAQGGRVKRHRHEAEAVFGWQKAERAVMAQLLLRGPQTVGELRTRCQRFVRFADLEVVSQVLNQLKVGRTLLIITHRLKFLQLADWIVFMRDGCCVAEGTPDELDNEDTAFHEYVHRHRPEVLSDDKSTGSTPDHRHEHETH